MSAASGRPERVLAASLPAHLGSEVRLEGWVHSYRQMGRLAFVTLRDRSGLCQVVLGGEQARAALPEESVVTFVGRVVTAPRTDLGCEVQCTEFKATALPCRTLPFVLSKKELQASGDTLLEHRLFGLRHPRQGAVLRVAAEIGRAFRIFLEREGFVEIHTPKIVAFGTEGGSSLFGVDYYGERAYLAQSPQLYKQMMVAAGYERVFEIGQAYRAEEHNTSRHLTEFTSLDVEMGFIESAEDVMNLETELLRSIFSALSERCARELALWGAAVPQVPVRIERIPILKAQQILTRRFGKISPEGDLDTEGERLICQYVGEKGRGSFVFLTEYPAKSKPFYIWPDPANPEVAHGFDLLFNGQEITSGGQRIHLPDVLRRTMSARGMVPAHFGPYLEAFELGCPPHGGFAIGLERLTALTLGLSNIREASAFPRDRQRLRP